MSGNFGMGVMLHMLGAHEGKALDSYFGKQMIKLRLDKDAPPDGALFLTFSDGSAVKVYDDARNCCEERYLHTDDALDQFVGATLMGVEVRDGPTTETKWGEPHDVQFLLITTSKGVFTLETHNEHNGYYGGFWLTVEPVEGAGLH